MFASREERLNRALISLVGLSIGDAFGDCFFVAQERALAWMDGGYVRERRAGFGSGYGTFCTLVCRNLYE